MLDNYSIGDIVQYKHRWGRYGDYDLRIGVIRDEDFDDHSPNKFLGNYIFKNGKFLIERREFDGFYCESIHPDDIVKVICSCSPTVEAVH